MMTKKFFDNKGVEYRELNLDTHPELIPELKEKGISTAPVVFIGEEDFIVGFQPGKFKKIAKVMVENK
jgi:glutaredoxin-like protein nrdH